MFMSLAIETEPELLPPKPVKAPTLVASDELAAGDDTAGATEG
jgi:hypothetical protein